MTYHSFMNDTGLVVRHSYYEGAIVPMHRQRGMSEQDFCTNFREIVAKVSGAKIITITDIGREVVSDDFYQLHEHGQTCTLAELLNSCDDTTGDD